MSDASRATTTRAGSHCDQAGTVGLARSHAALDLGLGALLDQHWKAALGSAAVAPAAQSAVAGLLERALHAPLDDFLSRPSKAFRAQLVRHAYWLAGGAGECPLPLLQLTELLHAGSLIVDDIQDESSTRRGAPTLHELHGVPIALNAANWLYFFALSLPAACAAVNTSPELECRLYRRLHLTLLECHHGQALDLSARVAELPQDSVPHVVQVTTRLKTGSLMALCAAIGAMGAGGSEAIVESLSQFGQDVGIALQMLDDTGALTHPKRQDKAQEDARHGRPTWPWAWLAQDLPPGPYSELQQLAARVSRGQASPSQLVLELRSQPSATSKPRVELALTGAMARLSKTLGASDALVSLRSELERLQTSYG